MVPPFTTPQRLVLEAVRMIGADGWSVTVREVKVATGLASTQTVHKALVELTERGVLRKHPRNPQGGWLPAAPS